MRSCTDLLPSPVPFGFVQGLYQVCSQFLLTFSSHRPSDEKRSTCRRRVTPRTLHSNAFTVQRQMEETRGFTLLNTLSLVLLILTLADLRSCSIPTATSYADAVVKSEIPKTHPINRPLPLLITAILLHASIIIYWVASTVLLQLGERKH